MLDYKQTRHSFIIRCTKSEGWLALKVCWKRYFWGSLQVQLHTLLHHPYNGKELEIYSLTQYQVFGSNLAILKCLLVFFISIPLFLLHKFDSYKSLSHIISWAYYEEYSTQIIFCLLLYSLLASTFWWYLIWSLNFIWKQILKMFLLQPNLIWS